MNEDRIKELLRRMDEGERVAVREGLAERVRGMQRKQRRVRVAGSAVAAVMVMVGMGVWMGSRGGQKEVAVRRPVVDERVELARLEVEARVHLAMAERMWELEEVSRKGRQAQRVVAGPMEVIARERERAAMIIVDQADRNLLGRELKEEAAKEYRAALVLFPGTRGAAMARQRLVQIGNLKEG